MDFEKKLSDNAIEQLNFLGSFAPTVNVKNREVKGYMLDSSDGECGKVYLDPNDLRKIASACNEVAEWLDERAEFDLR